MESLPLFFRRPSGVLRPCALILPFFFLAVSLAPAQQTAIGQVDFSSPQVVHSVFGMLEGASAAAPSPASSTALQPGLWRLGMYHGADLDSVYEQAAQSRAIIHYVVSNRFCYPVNQWCGTGAPYTNWTLYQTKVAQAVTDTKGKNVMFDVWNEPDSPLFWSGTQAQFFEAYLRAYNVLRNLVGPNVLIGGPSTGTYNRTFLKAFLDYCVAQGCQVNFLSWHELDDADQDIAAISTHLRDARSSFVNNPAYASLHLQRIDINETTGPLSKNFPGAILDYLFQLEQGGADGAARTCWPNSAAQSTCFNGSLDGLLTSNGWPCASWWAYKTYSDGVNSRVASTSSDSRVAILGTKALSGKSVAQILVGYYNSSAIQAATAAPMTVQLNLLGMDQLSFLTGASHVRVRLEWIPATGESPLSQPVLIQQSDVAWNGSSLTTTVPNIQAGEAYRITLWNPAASF
jgi:xylan 1,4-beta-xylosidase